METATNLRWGPVKELAPGRSREADVRVNGVRKRVSDTAG